MLDQLQQSMKNSVTALLANKARSFLTMLGIVIGVGAVIVIISVGAGAQSLILAQVEGLGSNLIGVLPGYSEDNAPPASAMGIVITTLTYQDAMALREKKNVPNIKEVIAFVKGVSIISWGSHTYDTNISGTTAGYIDVEGGEIEVGRFLTKEEETNLSRVIILGSTAKQELFGDSDAVGQRVKIKKHTFEVIGVMKERGTVAFQDYDDQVLIPIKTMQKLISGINHISMIRAKVDSDENIEKAIRDVQATLRERHDIADSSGGGDDFTVRSMAQALTMITTITNALKFFLAAMAALSLLVGGIGIMNIMFVTVTERTREIGLRKAIGASSKNIMSQFLFEATFITLLGGVVGVAGGALVSYIVAIGANFLDYDWKFSVSFLSIILAVSVSGMVGIIFGIYPARKASRLDPIEALRHE